MCGFAGFLTSNPDVFGNLEVVATRMALTIQHRGPDDAGAWADAQAGIALGHRRLSILDPSFAGHQPMRSISGRFMLVFNGEIYNHMALRVQLDTVDCHATLSATSTSQEWYGRSDTETLLAGIEAWGLEATLKKSIGMFAIALWDRKTRTLTLARDRMGEKPLYYGFQGHGHKRVFLFGSELKALKAHNSFSADIDRDALCLLLRHNYIPAPYSIYQNIAKLEPGCLLSISLDKPEPKVWKYWDAVKVALNGAAQPFVGTTHDAVDALEILAKDAVRQQMLADVPLGAFLSGGIDSSTVVGLMQSQSSRPIKTFTIGFNEKSYNEATYAKAVARHLGTDHNELIVTSAEAIEVIPRLPNLYCEPFADSSQIPTFLVSQFAKQHVTVSLSGDAGDELFCGYNRYLMAKSLWQKLSILPLGGRQFLAHGLTSLSPAKWNTLLGLFYGLGPTELRQINLGDRIHKGARVLTSGGVDSLYLGLISCWDDPASVVIGGREPSTILTGNTPKLSGFDDIQRMMILDTLSYLPDDILVKIDRATMGVSLEGRVPFLDHRVVEFAWNLPQNMKLRNGVGKWVLRQVLHRYVPKKLIERPKMGFGVPISEWLRGPLKEWAEALLNEDRLRREGFFRPEWIRSRWAEHLSGECNWQYQLWSVLMFQAWLEGER